MRFLYRAAGWSQKVRLQAACGHGCFREESCRLICRRYFRMTPWAFRVWEVPSQREVQLLQQTFHNPKELINNLLGPLVDGGVASEPRIVFTPRQGLGGKLWKATLHLNWPSNVSISGVHPTMSGAEGNAFLLACSLYKDMGLLYKQNAGHMAAVDQDYVFNMLRRLHTLVSPLSHLLPQFHVCTTPAEPTRITELNARGENQNPPVHLWETHVHAEFPFAFDVCETGPSVHISQYAAALRACMKLKALGLLTRSNHQSPTQHTDLPKSVFVPSYFPSSPEDNFDPHYEIYSDASAKGFGAYLVTRDDDRVRWLANSWTEHFPHYDGRVSKRRRADTCIKPEEMLPDSNFFEMYAVVAACFTWKHKFVEQRVLVWSDNAFVVTVINGGVRSERSLLLVGKLFQILCHTCSRNRIELRAAHVQRTENTAADLLSRFQVAKFREVIPEAAPACKKTKKLLFWNPLQTLPHLKQTLFKDSGDTIQVQSTPAHKSPLSRLQALGKSVEDVHETSASVIQNTE
ncbi:hypothetical protein BaRGS_00009244 [Batillaria attramentaria]|uniref:RNase H type-1 domain-containing protein n=1 Tax=Batillaria attramentaria TaxID=370345 RepID=A0ABD0LJA2_9CAEN